jgi:hypothetical protein
MFEGRTLFEKIIENRQLKRLRYNVGVSDMWVVKNKDF